MFSVLSVCPSVDSRHGTGICTKIAISGALFAWFACDDADDKMRSFVSKS